MAKSELLRALLEKLAELAEDPDTRVVGQWPDDPSKWYPTSVIDPRTNRPFTEASAWEFVAEMLLGEDRVNVVALEHPADKAGYTMNIDTPDGTIYVKFREGMSKIIGRSFHYSEHKKAIR